MTITITTTLQLHPWQREAIGAWRAAGRRGIVEAVTGTGKTRVGVAAIAEAFRAGLRSVVLVPSVSLQDQWVRAIRELLPELEIGRLGAGRHTRLRDCGVLVAVVNSAVKHLPDLRGATLLVADECHHYGAGKHARALVDVRWRLGLTATLERSDDGVDRVLLPYFGTVVHRTGYDRALADGIVAPFAVDLVGVDFGSTGGRAEYDRLTGQIDAARHELVARHGYPRNPGEFLQRAMAGTAGWQSREGWLCSQYSRAFTARRELMAAEPAKLNALRALAPDICASSRCLVFTQVKDAALRAAATLRAAGVQAEAIHSGLTAGQRRTLLARFESGEMQALVAPQVLDEGVDLPDADLGIIVSASRSRRQMIQRMGRILRRKSDGRPARFIILTLAGTAEDPATGAHEAFLDEVLPHATRVGRRLGPEQARTATNPPLRAGQG